MDHLGLLEILARRSGAEVAALRPARPLPRGLHAPAPTADDEFAHGGDAPPRRPRRAGHARCGSVGAAFRAFGSSGQVTRAAARRRRARRCATARSRVLHRPGHSPSDTVFWDERARDPDRRRPPAGAHLLQPADLAAAGRAAEPAPPRPTARTRWSSTSPRCGRPASCPPQLVLAGPRRPPVARPRRADRRALPHAPRGAPRKILRLLAGGRSDRVRDRQPDVGQRRGHAGLPDALGGARATSTCSSPTGGPPRTTRAAVTLFEAVEP